MRISASISGRSRAFGALAAAVTAVLMVTGLATAGGAAARARPQSTIAPTGLSVFASTSNTTDLGGAVPTVLAQAGVTPITLTVSLLQPGAVFTKDTTLTVSAGGSGQGSFSPSTFVFPANQTTTTTTVTYSAVDNGVIATVSGPKVKGTTITPGSSSPFDVLKDLRTGPPSDFQTGLPIGNNDCTAATTEPECGILTLPNGANSNVALSLGTCTGVHGCIAGGQVVQFIADLGNFYSANSPATLIIRCNKTLCKGKSITNYPVNYSTAVSGALSTTLQPCVAKGVAKDAFGNLYCTDYVQSHRDNAGDLLLYVLVTKDFRASTS